MGKWQRILRPAGTCVLLWALSVVPAAGQRIHATLEASDVSVVNDVAQATFTIAVRNEEQVALGGLVVVFEDGFEVTVGDIAAESTRSSGETSRSFELDQQARSRVHAVPATLKYSVDGNPVEQATSIVLRLPEQ
jgi:hypothetical protein